MKEQRTLPGAEEVKEKNRIEEVVSRYLSLQRCGHKDSFVGLCPFHDDHHPSLHVDGEKQLFKCFSCSEGGDVISFVMKIEQCSFPEALKRLAGERADSFGTTDSSISSQEGAAFSSPLERGLGGVLSSPVESSLPKREAVGGDNTPPTPSRETV